MDSNSNSILTNYENLLGKKSVSRIKKKAEELQQYSILNVNSTKFGGGVAEILNSMLPLMKELGLDVDWRTFTAPDKFFEISKKMHNALQGNMDIYFTDEEIAIYKKQASDTYKQVNPNEDFVVIHDPQPCPVIGELNKKEINGFGVVILIHQNLILKLGV
jgi:trehalose synthase